MNRKVESVILRTMLFFALMAVLGLALFHTVSGADFLLFLGMIFLSLLPAAVVHEIGHAFAVLLLGLRLFTLTIGGAADRILVAWRVFGYDVVVRCNPFGGSVHFGFKSMRCARLRYFLVVLSGLVANGLLIVAALPLHDRSSRKGMVFWMTTGFVCGSAIVFAISAVPLRFWSRKRRHRTDGWLLLTIPFMARRSLEDLHSGTFCYEAMEALQRDKVQEAEQWVAKGMEIYPENSWGLVAQASILDHEHKYAEAREAFLRALNQPALTTELRATLWNNIAWMDLMLADPALLEEADRFSRQALKELPWQSYVRGTRGGVLIELGQIDEGVWHVEQALRYNYPGTSKALNACYLAIAEVRRRDYSKALDYLDEAKRRDPKCRLIERAVMELDQRPRLPEFDSH